MRDDRKTKIGLIKELEELRCKLQQLESVEESASVREKNLEYELITSRKKTEESLRLSEERFFKAFHANPNAMTLSNMSEGRYIEVNDSFINLIGYSREELIGKSIEELKIPVKPTRTEILTLLRGKGTIRGMEVQIRTKSKEIKTALLSSEVIDLHGDHCVLVMLDDITEKKKMEKEIARLDRLNLIGQMAAGIGHEIRNPMTTVRGFLQMLANKESDQSKKEYYNIMIEELDRANFIITEFLSLAKDRLVKLGPVCINVLLNTLYPLLSVEALKQDKRIVLKKGDIPKLMANEKEMRQLIINLVRNGLEAMPPNGTLNIGTYYKDNEIGLYVEDEGSGIQPEILDKLGTPFVTTKETGTGLGLAVCYSIVDRHNAKIDVATSPEGTTFLVRFKLPAIQVNSVEELVACSESTE